MSSSVLGYKPQPKEAIEIINGNKIMEEHVLRVVDSMRNPHFDQRWVSIARSHIEQGFMALNRAVFQPERIEINE